MAYEVIIRAVGGFLVGFCGPDGVYSYFSLVGTSSLWMFLVGGLSMLIIGMINEIEFIRKNFNVFFQTLLGASAVIILELVSGLILNVWLNLNLWSYANFKFNFLEQISLETSLFWFAITPLAYWLDDVLRYVFYKEGKIYNLFELYLTFFKIWEKPKFQV
jgi:uncharacterized membrane protein